MVRWPLLKAASKADVARIHGVMAKVVVRWVERFLSEGPAGMADRSSRNR